MIFQYCFLIIFFHTESSNLQWLKLRDDLYKFRAGASLTSLVVLHCKVNESIISPALMEVFSIAVMQTDFLAAGPSMKK